MDRFFWRKKKKGPAVPVPKEEQDGRIRTVAVGVGFVLFALAFMWVSSLKDAHDASRAALEEAYALRIAAAANPAPVIDPYAHSGLPWVSDDEVDLDQAVVDVAGYQNDFVRISAEGYTNFDVYAEKVQAAWDNMEQWFPNDSAHSWYDWDMSSISAGWQGYNLHDGQGRPMGIWLCTNSDNNLLAYAMAWYAGGHMYSNWTSGITAFGYASRPNDTYEDEFTGAYEPTPGDGDMSDGRTLDDHIDSALTILDGLGMSHNWYDAIANTGEEEEGGGSDVGQTAAGEAEESGAGQSGGETETGSQDDGPVPGPAEAG